MREERLSHSQLASQKLLLYLLYMYTAAVYKLHASLCALIYLTFDLSIPYLAYVMWWVFPAYEIR